MPFYRIMIFYVHKIRSKTNLPLIFQRSLRSLPVDFCIVLGNLLENAYLECKTLQKYEKFIHLKARQTSPGAFVLLIENPYEHEIKKQTVASSYPLAAKTASVQVLNQSLPYVKNTMAICLLRLITTALKSRCFYNVNSID